MELTQLLKGKTVFIDTAPFIYFIEKNSRYHQIVKPVISLIDSSQVKASPPPSPCLRCLSSPSEKANERLQYKAILLDSAGLTTLEITHQISERAAHLRAKHSLRTPDALQLATALVANADYFLTNDITLKKAKEIKVLLLDDLLKVHQG